MLEPNSIEKPCIIPTVLAAIEGGDALAWSAMESMKSPEAVNVPDAPVYICAKNLGGKSLAKCGVRVDGGRITPIGCNEHTQSL